MFGYIIKHNDYNKFLGFNRDNKCVWTSRENAYTYATLYNAEVAVRQIRSYAKYKDVALSIINVKDQEVKVI